MWLWVATRAVVLLKKTCGHALSMSFCSNETCDFESPRELLFFWRKLVAMLSRWAFAQTRRVTLSRHESCCSFEENLWPCSLDELLLERDVWLWVATRAVVLLKKTCGHALSMSFCLNETCDFELPRELLFFWRLKITIVNYWANIYIPYILNRLSNAHVN